MELWVGETAAVRGLILFTAGKAPKWQETGLLCCRSLTLGVEVLLLGPMDVSPPYWLEQRDIDGIPQPLTVEAAELFAALLREKGWKPGTLTDGSRCWAGLPADAVFHRIPEAERKRLLGL